MRVTRDELLEGYLAHAEAVSHDREDENFWAFSELHDLIQTDVEAAWVIAVELIARVSDDSGLAYVAAGPLEDLLCKHPEFLIGRVEARARDRRFRKALRAVWGVNRMPATVRARIEVIVAKEPPW